MGADVVSIGELQKVLKVGFKPNKIVFSGVGKTSSELDFAIKKKILLINVESESELKNIINLSKNKKTVVNVGIRLNPNVNAQTIGKISTGRMQDKFGLNFKDAIKIVDKYKNSDSIKFKCLSVHIGSQILSNVPYQKMIRVVNNFLEKVSVNFEYVDFGGGMGIDYSSKKKTFDFKKLALEIHKFSKRNECKIILEPGRSIIGDTAVLISKVIYIKESPTKDFIILDAGMNDLIRPALYNAKHMIIPAILLGLSMSAVTMRMTRTMMLEVLRQDYVRTARAKGLSEFMMIIRHALRNGLMPVVTLIGLQAPLLIGGAVILEQIFVVPGMGLLLLEAVFQRDYPVISGIFLIVGLGVLLINLCIDLSYGFLDPKVRHQ